MKINTIDRVTLHSLSVKALTAVKPIFDELGLSVKLGGGTYGRENGTIKLEIAVIGDNGIAQSPDRTAYTLYYKLFDLQPEWLDQSFTSQGKTYIVRGLKPNAPKYPVLCEEGVTHKTYKFPAETVIRALTNPAPHKTAT